ncbi:poly [ADP-ribose] polymerase tankyrase-like [Contarinia nasturtii]|uniref:poly [ADP-ribose] polymerase tankyrase-like n=1 Tax=Contarinia nasturtii TaxID=265458 RepID=UPI0012D43F8D|nr:poly [ADP-ribose] polymerase tankyrase-like [Contarinia nasturtii]
MKSLVILLFVCFAHGASILNDKSEPIVEATPTELTNENDEIIEETPEDFIEQAISKNDADAVKFLIEGYGIDKNYLFRACELCSPAVANMLIVNGTSVHDYSGQWMWRPIHYATYNNCKEITKMLIEKGADVNAKIQIGYTPLHIAAHNNRYKIAKLLINHGADPSIRDSWLWGRTALEWAESKNHEEVMDVLTEGYNNNNDDKVEY